MVPMVSQNDLVMVNIYTCFQTPYIRSIRKKVTFVSRLQITEITVELFFFVTSINSTLFKCNENRSSAEPVPSPLSPLQPF